MDEQILFLQKQGKEREGQGQEEGQGEGQEEGQGQGEGQGQRRKGRGRREKESVLDNCKILLISHTCRRCNGEAGGSTTVTGRLTIHEQVSTHSTYVCMLMRTFSSFLIPNSPLPSLDPPPIQLTEACTMVPR